jgi:hypothetical protein
MFDIFDTIKGIDGQTYVVKDNKLVKIVRTKSNELWKTTTDGWCKIYLEDGTIYQIGNN